MSHDILVYHTEGKYIVALIPNLTKLFSVNFHISSCSASKRYIVLKNNNLALVYDRLYKYSSLITCANFVKVIDDVVVTYCNKEIWLRGEGITFKLPYKPEDVTPFGNGIAVCTPRGLYILSPQLHRRIDIPCNHLSKINNLLVLGVDNKLLLFDSKKDTIVFKISLYGKILKIAVSNNKVYVLTTKGLYVFKLVYVDLNVTNTIIFISVLLSLIYLGLRRIF